MLKGLGLDFSVRPVDLDESVRPGETPSRYVERLAIEKAAARCGSGELTLAADTSVEIDDQILGKPRDKAEARAMLGRLAGQEHRVYTGVALCLGDNSGNNHRSLSDVVTSKVWIAPMSETEIAWYVDTGEPMDKAGSYAIQGLGNLFVERNDGNYTNVVGLPLPTVYRLFGQLGFSLLDYRQPNSPQD